MITAPRSRILRIWFVPDSCVDMTWHKHIFLPTLLIITRKNCAAEKTFSSYSETKALGNVAKNFLVEKAKNYLKFIFSGVSFTPMSFWILLEQWKKYIRRRNLAMNTTIIYKFAYTEERNSEDVKKIRQRKKKNRAKTIEDYQV